MYRFRNCIVFISLLFLSYSCDEDDGVDYDVFPGPCYIDLMFDDEIVSYRRVYLYNDDNLLVKMESWAGEKEDLDYWYSYEYNDKNLLVKKSWILPGNNPERYDYYYYDEFDRLVREEIDADADGVVTLVYVYKYDENNNVIARERVDSDTGELVEVIVYEYNEQNQMVLANSGDDYDSLILSGKYYYDDIGNLVREEYFNYDDLINPNRIIENSYDDNGNLLEWLNYYDEGEDLAIYLCERDWWTYDEFGNVLEEYHNYGDNQLSCKDPLVEEYNIKYVYNYDCW